MGKKEIWGKLQQMILEIAGDDTIVIEQDTKLIEDCGFDSLNMKKNLMFVHSYVKELKS